MSIITHKAWCNLKLPLNLNKLTDIGELCKYSSCKNIVDFFKSINFYDKL